MARPVTTNLRQKGWRSTSVDGPPPRPVQRLGGGDRTSHLVRAVLPVSAALAGMMVAVSLACLVPRGSSLSVYPAGMLYGALVAGWLSAQIALCHAECRRQRRFLTKRHSASVAVIIPTYNEDAEILRGCVASVLAQDYDGHVEAVVVDDGSEKGIPSLGDEVGANLPNRILRCVCLPENRGKRHAQAAGLRETQADFIATVDSDTRLERDAIDRALLQFEDPCVGAVTGVSLVDNRVNLLTRLIHLRYWNAFCQERASQSYLGIVTCCSGVFSVYRRDLLMSVLPQYLTQRFLGKPCTYGDDRHLTNLLLWQGHEIRVALDALAWTQAPTKVQVWARQQRRWSQSFYREFLWSLRFAHQRNYYFAYCLLFQAVLPLFLLYGLGHGTFALAAGEALVALRYAVAVVVMGLVRGAYGLYRTRDHGFLLMPLYGFLHLLIVIPVRLVALLTLWDNRWGTR